MSIEQLAEQAGVSVRTVRYYISQGLLPGPGARGKYASYGDDHLARLQLIRRLVDQHVPLAEQRERLQQLSADDLRRLLQEEEQHSRVMQQAPSPRDYVSRLLAHAREPEDYRTPVQPPLAAPLTSPPGPAPPPEAASAAAPFRRRALALSGEALPEDASISSTSTGAAPEHVQRWTLAPGIELLVRTDAAKRHATLIAELLKVAAAYLPRRDPIT